MTGNPSDSLIATAVQIVPPRELPAGTFVIEVTSGPDLGVRTTLSANRPSPLLVGQSPACTLRLSDAQVSRRHLSLDVVHEGLRVIDLGSTNGTFVDRVRILDAILQGGELLQIGGTAFRVTYEDELSEGAPPEKDRFGKILGASHEMRRLYPLCERLAAASVAVVIEGETGTGKEVLAESLHEMGPRAAEPFVVFDCTAVPASLMESELFGHEKGAFTGAVATRRGVFEQANGGTLFIDEIGDLDLTLQPKLLRALERGEVRRLGGERWIRVDVRIVAATRRDLDREVQAGRFRDDLFHRLAVARIELPPLRARLGDVRVIATRIWADLGGDPRILTPDVLARWEAYSWPGNVRELRNAVARQLALGDLATGFRVGHGAPDKPSADQGDFIDSVVSERVPFPKARDAVVEEFERRYVTAVLAEHDGDVARAATASGIGRRYFQMIRARAKSGA